MDVRGIGSLFQIKLQGNGIARLGLMIGSEIFTKEAHHQDRKLLSWFAHYLTGFLDAPIPF
jgi:hypothetical protein